jgi:hypothetical protein
LFVLLALVAAIMPLAWRAATPVAPSLPAAPARPQLDTLPLIIMSTGDAAAPFGALSSGGGLAFKPDAVSLSVGDSRLTVRFLGAQPDTTLVPAERRRGLIGSRIGDDPSRWREGVPTYAALDYRSLFPGVDLRYGGVCAS